MTEDPLAIPDFLRVFNIRKDVLDEAIEVVSNAGNEELTQKLKSISAPPTRLRIKTKLPLFAPDDIAYLNVDADNRTITIELPDPQAKKIRLTRKLKEDTIIRICQLIDDGHNTFARLKKASGVDDRVLKSAIRHGLAHDVGNLRLTKITAKVYGIHKR
jgi:hypothetical protein